VVARLAFTIGFFISLSAGLALGGDDVSGASVLPRGPWEAWRTRRLLDGSRRASERAQTAPLSCGQIRLFKDLAYGCDCRQRLDLYLPACAGFPVVIYVHGGSWIAEDKATYPMVGRYFAAHGVGAVLLNYRLPPEAGIEQELEDVASGVAWACRHIGHWGGDRCRLFLCGHSSGGHLVSVLATDPEWLEAEGLTIGAIAGVITIGGVYHIGVNVRPFGVGYVFAGTDRQRLSPREQVHPCLPPLLIVNAQQGSRYLKLQARRFRNAILSEGGRGEEFVVPGEDHYGQILNIACPEDQLGCRVLQFIGGIQN
jgi:alpha/beta hydrolase fold